MSQDRQRFQEPTIQEMVADPIVIALMRADNVEPKALEELLHVAVSSFALRSEARRLPEMAKTVADPYLKRGLAAQAFNLTQRAEAIARWHEDPESLYTSIEHYRARLAAGIEDANQRQIMQQILREAEQLAARLSDPRQSSSTGKITEAIGPNTSNHGKR